MSIHTYRELELAWDSPKLILPVEDRLRPHESCLLLRRRARMTQAELAKRMGRCRHWVNLMERGLVEHDELVTFWEKQ